MPEPPLAIIVQFVSVGLPPLYNSIPAPVLPVIVHLSILGDTLFVQYTPLLPPVIVKPLRMQSAFSLLANVTTLLPPLIIVAATTAGLSGSVELRVRFLPLKSMSS